MTTSFADLLLAAYNRPDPNPFLYNEGQKVRLKKKVLDNGQTPLFWIEKPVKIVQRYCTGMHKEHWYVLEHSNGATDDFREEEIDGRYRIRGIKCISKN